MERTAFKEPWYTPYHFIRKGVDVQCPNCGGHATSTGASAYLMPWHPTDTRLICTHCAYTKTEDKASWSGPVIAFGSRPCGNCGHKWVQAKLSLDRIPPKSFALPKVDCPVCRSPNEVTLSWERDVFNGRPIDPYNGETLWYLDQVKGNPLWAYNLSHLVYLRNFVTSPLRERDENAGKYSVLTNLPKWMKAQKNRDAIVRALARLEQKT
ncbi:MAG: hypothetical protein MI802_00150 [Desulfobacterales bacterium]|nr:hypothetical protein [Desulfobacterales bacterium]